MNVSIKKIFFSGILLLEFGVKAQLKDGSIAPDFTANDINGKTWTLSKLLAEEKTVILEISATWCPPCWAYHCSGNLDNFYEAYGPNGSDQVMVLFIEGSSGTDLLNLKGKKAPTCGDWITGIPYPIFENDSIPKKYKIRHFPTMYMISPAGKTKLVDQHTTSQLIDDYNSMNEKSLIMESGNIKIDNLQLISCEKEGSAVVTIRNLGTSVTSVDFVLKEDEVSIATKTFNGTIDQFETVKIVFNDIVPDMKRNHTVEITSVNGVKLQKSIVYEDTVLKDFSRGTVASNDIAVKIETDFWISDMKWTIKDLSDSSYVNGGPYEYKKGCKISEHDDVHISLPDGCYVLNIEGIRINEMSGKMSKGFIQLNSNGEQFVKIDNLKTKTTNIVFEINTKEP